MSLARALHEPAVTGPMAAQALHAPCITPHCGNTLFACHPLMAAQASCANAPHTLRHPETCPTHPEAHAALEAGLSCTHFIALHPRLAFVHGLASTAFDYHIGLVLQALRALTFTSASNR